MEQLAWARVRRNAVLVSPDQTCRNPSSKQTLGLSIQRYGLPMRIFEPKEQEVANCLGKAVYSMAPVMEQFAANWQ